MEKGKYNILNFKLYYIIQGVYMVIEEFRSGSTLIRFDDRDIVTQEKNAEQIDLIIQFIIKIL